MLPTKPNTDPDVYQVWAICNVDNTRSVQLMERAGFALVEPTCPPRRLPVYVL